MWNNIHQVSIVKFAYIIFKSLYNKPRRIRQAVGSVDSYAHAFVEPHEKTVTICTQLGKDTTIHIFRNVERLSQNSLFVVLNLVIRFQRKT